MSLENAEETTAGEVEAGPTGCGGYVSGEHCGSADAQLFCGLPSPSGRECGVSPGGGQMHDQ